MSTVVDMNEVGEEIRNAEKECYGALLKLSFIYFKHDCLEPAMLSLNMAQHLALGLESDDECAECAAEEADNKVDTSVS